MAAYEALVIEVTGINNNTSKDTLENYFSSSRRGGDIVNIEYIKGSGNASITFANAEGAKKALETSPHSLEESTLTTQRKKAEISESDKVFVEAIPTKPSENDTERISDLDVKDITHDTKSSDNLNAIVTFYSPVDFHKIKEGFKNKPMLEGKDISIKTVPLCKTILVKNLPNTASDDTVLCRFESKRFGGGEVEDSGVHLDSENGIAIVEFKDPNVIDKVLSVKQIWDNTTLSVERYYPILGNIADLKLTGQETIDPTCREVPTVMPGQHEDVIEIVPVHLKLLETSTRFQRLENSLKGDGCEIYLDETKGRITVKGSQAQIQNLKVEIQDIVEDEKSALPQTGNREAVKLQLRKLRPGKKDPNKNFERRGITALTSAVMTGNRKDVDDLLERGADVNAKDELGNTALIWAAFKGNGKVVAHLLEKGADVNAMDKAVNRRSKEHGLA